MLRNKIIDRMASSVSNKINTPLVLTLDIGTSSTRAMLFDGSGQPVDGMEAQVQYEMHTTPDGGVEISATELLDFAARALDLLLQQAGPAAPPIAGVGVCTFWHNLLGIDADGRPLTPVYSWADTRSAPAVAELRARLDEDAVHARTGCVFHSSYLPAKLLWLSRSQPKVFRRVRHWMSIGEYLFLVLFGRTVCSLSMASATGMFDQNLSTWDGEVLSALSVDPSQLSPLGDLDTPLAGLEASLAQRWPMLTSVPWYPALGDGACNNIGSGCVTLERLALMVGTSGAMRVLWESDRVRIPRGLWCYRADRRRFVMGGALSNGGNVFRWLMEHLRFDDEVHAVERRLAAMLPDAHGLTVLPFWAGERSPDWVSDAKAVLIGLNLNTEPIDILRAVLESVAYRFAAIYEILCEAAPDAQEIIASGGGLLHSPTWMQIMADVLGKPVVASAVKEASSRGAALLVLEALGVLHDLAAVAVPRATSYNPDPKHHARYQQAMARHRKVYRLFVDAKPWAW